MPSYMYTCKKCGSIFSDINTVSKRDTTECECGGKAERNVEAELAPKKMIKWVTEKERWSTSMGVPRDQVDEFRKRFPNSTYRDDGRLLIKNRSDKLRQMKERGMRETHDIECKAWFV